MNRSPLVAQRLLVAALLGTAFLSAFLLWALRSRQERGLRAPQAEVPAPGVSGSPLAALPGAGAPAPVLPERQVLEPSAPAVRPTAAEQGFDPTAIYGQVTCDGTPRADVELRLFSGTLERRDPKEPLARAVSADGGRFRFPDLTAHARYTLHAQGADCLPEEFSAFPGCELELELEPAAGVGGRVLAEATLAPVPGIEVALGRRHFGATGCEDLVRATSDAQGLWRLPWAEPGMQEFLVLRPGFLPERHEFQVGPEGGDGYDILLASELALELEVTALESGALLADTEVLVDDARARTDARGRIGVPLPPQGFSDEWLRLSLALPGGCQTGGRVHSVAGPRLVRVPLTRGGTVRGRVLDAAGAPVAGARLRVQSPGRPAPGLNLPEGFWLNASRAVVRSDGAGRFELTGLPPRESPIEIHAQHPEHPPGSSGPFPFTELGQSHEVEIRLERGGTLAGHVTLDGAPAALRVFWSGERDNGWTQANDRGAYLCRGVTSGELLVGARLADEDEEVPRAEDRRVWLEEQGSLTCDLDLASNRSWIRGRVVDTAGDPIADAELGATPVDESEGDGFESTGQSAADGSFELSVPDTRGLSFRVWVASGPRQATVEDVLAGEDDLELVLPALARLWLRVVDSADRRSVQGFQLYWRESTGGTFERLYQGGRRFSAGAEGVFVAELPAGRLDLAITARSRGYAPAHVGGHDLAPGDPTGPLEVLLEPGVELELEFETESPELLGELRRSRPALASDEQWRDRPRGGAFFQQEVRQAQTARVDDLGLARVQALPSGSFRVFNLPKGLTVRPRTFEVPRVESLRVTLTLERDAPEGKPGRRDD